MSQKTQNFQDTQKPRWENGDPANGENFAQFIEAIATLVEETRAEAVADAVGQANSQAVSEDRNKQLAKEVLNTAGDYNTQALYTELVAKINQKSDLTSEQAKALAKEVLNTASDYEGTGLYNYIGTKIADSVHAFNYDTDAKAQVAQDFAELVKPLSGYTYTFDGTSLKVAQNGQGEPVTISADNGAKYLKPTNGKEYVAEVLTADKKAFVLVRPDGGRLVYDVDAQTVKPAANLIG